MIEAFVIALIVAKLKGYRITPLFKVWAIYPYLAVFTVSVAFYISSFFTLEYAKYGFIVRHGFTVSWMALWLYLLWSLRPVHLILLPSCMIGGGLLNRIVIGANGGKMPYLHTVSKLFRDFDLTTGREMYVPISSSTRFPFLADVIDTGYELYSLGDVLIFVVPGVLVYLLVRRVNESVENQQIT